MTENPFTFGVIQKAMQWIERNRASNYSVLSCQGKGNMIEIVMQHKPSGVTMRGCGDSAREVKARLRREIGICVRRLKL